MLDFLNTVDMNIMLWIHQHLSNMILNISMPFITNEKNWTLPILLLIFILGFKTGKKGQLTLILLIIALACTDSICAQVFKPFFERIRPSHLNLEGIHLLVSKGGKWSMPSNHAANIFSFAAVLSYFYNRFTLLLYIIAILIAFSRVYIGVHFPGDVIIGGFLGYFIALMVLTFWGIIKLREIKKGRKWILID